MNFKIIECIITEEFRSDRAPSTERTPCWTTTAGIFTGTRHQEQGTRRTLNRRSKKIDQRSSTRTLHIDALHRFTARSVRTVAPALRGINFSERPKCFRKRGMLGEKVRPSRGEDSSIHRTRSQQRVLRVKPPPSIR